MQRRPAFGLVFLLNNTPYLCTKLLQSLSPPMDILSRPTQDALNFNFSPHLQALADGKDKIGGGKPAASAF
jgi:hypothetical protein